MNVDVDVDVDVTHDRWPLEHTMRGKKKIAYRVTYRHIRQKSCVSVDW
jgi:hypothetical protein